MNRQHYRNNFVQGENYVQQNVQPTPTRNTRQNPSVVIKNEAPAQQPTFPQQQSVPTPMKVEQPEAATNVNASISEDDLLKLKKINFKKKVSGKEKRQKQNKKLFRMLTPRNAIAALNELHGQSEMKLETIPVHGNKFEAEIVINNVKFTGLGSSKMAAKNAACEKALRDLVINKFKQIKHEPATPTASMSEDVSMDESDGTDSTEVPMLQLASFALHKLFSEWEAEGFEIPFPKLNADPNPPVPNQNNGTEKQALPKAPKVRNELPSNNTQMHPVMLLSVMRPCTQYQDLGSQGVTPNIIHSAGCTVDGQSFIAQGRSKKEARKRVATDVLMKLFEWKGSCC